MLAPVHKLAKLFLRFYSGTSPELGAALMLPTDRSRYLPNQELSHAVESLCRTVYQPLIVGALIERRGHHADRLANLANNSEPDRSPMAPLLKLQLLNAELIAKRPRTAHLREKIRDLFKLIVDLLLNVTSALWVKYRDSRLVFL
jgi:hypothetical protein